MTKHQDKYQIALIGMALLVVFGIGAFIYHELFPEYKTYQYAYEELEKFRSTYTHEQPAPFSMGIKQIVIPQAAGGPEVIDRCISCHVAMDLPHFSPTRPTHDAEGNVVLEPNPDYIWQRLAEADRLEALKGGRAIEKALQMHPLMPGETRPFQFHPMGQYGCTSCHSGNGRSLVAKRAHGPVYDTDYEPFCPTPKPQFTEVDPQNDPPFARMYNSKPGHDLVFQTTPLLAGPLIVANCVQCHQPAPKELGVQNKENVQSKQPTVDRMISSYQRGKELFVSQACYACHRIAGFSRASVGPELTRAGNSYPWYIKESIVWPQADLPSSTMPNFHLDHDELAALMVFLMAQKGNTKAVSEVDYLTTLNQWEKGAKMPWEEPVPPTRIDNVRAGQLVFATEGCASCHKLQGFETNAFLKNPSVDQQWFYKQFPEHISGSQLAEKISEQAPEIDKRIGLDPHRQGVIEEIDQKYPGLIAGFYTHFKCASRALNADEQERLDRVLSIYIQEYGLGRDIAPHLNWSGVYRDDEWLLGHFHNPSAYTARSIMPVMPFDDSKFYMFNHMLHALGRKNRDKLQEIWRTGGFNPPLAFERLCSSCHGEQRQGNGIISEWIYPIPKNLRDPIFLRNLTKDRAIDSITHGVPGTPMPPWGEAVSPLELGDHIPVLTRTEIAQLVDWLYQSVPYEPQTETVEDYKKWHYTARDAVVEMQREKQWLQPAPAEKTADGLVEEYFAEKENPLPGPDNELYYIREKYYTQENLEEGKQLFLVNCATCHGNEGGGTGLRASSMVEAKPRMFTNLPWIRTRDDLRLLRSIKYGVPGTAMTPWGDQTTSVQRLQLVLFIRELTRTTLQKSDLDEILYATFDTSILQVEKARTSEYAHLEQLETSLQQVRHTLHAGEASEEQLGSLYAQSIKLEKVYREAQAKDRVYQQLIEAIKEEKEIYASIGGQMISANLPLQPLYDHLKNRSAGETKPSLFNANVEPTLKAKIETQLDKAASLRQKQQAFYP